MRSGRLRCGPVLHCVVRSYIARSGPTLGVSELGRCSLAFLDAVRSYIGLSGPIFSGPAVHWAAHGPELG